MLACTNSCATVGLEGYIIRVEVDLSPGVPRFNMVGLPDTAVQEAKERVRAALRNSGCEFPMRRITVNLAPADLKKEGPAYDLPIAIGILLSSGQLESAPAGAVFLGELSLDGSLRHTNGILAMVSVARDQGYDSVFVPAMNAEEASLVEDITVYPATTLDSVVRHLKGESLLEPMQGDAWIKCSALPPVNDPMDLAHIRGQEHAKRALEVAAAGFHNLLFSGPPGSGKTLLARCLPSILPRMAPTGSAGGHQDIQRNRRPAEREPADDAAPLSLAALHHLQRRAGGRRTLVAPRRNHPEPPRSAISR